MISVDPTAVKRESERIILAAGGRILDWLPHLDVERRGLRSKEEIIARALAMNALINIAFSAPVHVIADWIERHGVGWTLTDVEREILKKSQQTLEEQERINLHWYLESLWALMWVGGVVDELAFDDGVPDTMVTLVPNLQKNEDGAKFSRFRIRPDTEVFRKLDLYFRLHWYARDGSLTGTPTPPVQLSVVLERRRALEWALDREHDWDHVEMST